MISNEYPFVINSNDDNIVDSNLGHIRFNLGNQPLVFNCKYEWIVKMESLKIPYVVPNIVTGVNDTMRYSYGGSDYDITLEQGIYGISQISSSLTSYLSSLGANGFDTDSYGTVTYHVELEANTSLGMCYIKVNKAGASISFPTGTLYENLGFTSAQVSGGISTTTLGSNLVDIYANESDEIFLYTNFTRSQLNNNSYSGVLYNAVWTSSAHTNNIFPSTNEKIIAFLKMNQIYDVEIKVQNRLGETMAFHSNTPDDISIRLRFIPLKKE